MTGQINIHWRGPHSYEDVRGMDGEADRGLYQIYGTHPVYGAGTLLYIGRTWENTFRERFSDHEKLGKLADLQWESNSFQWRIHTGRVHLPEADSRPGKEALSERVEMAEHLLICAHWPAWNSQHLIWLRSEPRYHGLHVLNWGQHGLLLPEVSGARFTNTEVYTGLSDDPVGAR